MHMRRFAATLSARRSLEKSDFVGSTSANITWCAKADAQDILWSLERRGSPR
jgi:hypothetical protein